MPNDPNPSTSTSKPAHSHTWAFLTEDVTAEWGDLVLAGECLATGLLDSAAFNVWSCFVSMQTGNTVYFGLGASGQPVSQPWRWAKSGVSILSFMLGSFAFSRFMRAMGPRRRGVIIFCLALQALLTFGAALSATTGLVPPDAGNQLPHNWIVLFPLAMLSAQAGGQCVLSRALGYNEMPSVVLTSASCDLVMDPQIFSSITANAKRNRRVASAFMILAGAAIGGFMTKDTDIGPALWLGSALKTVMAASWLFWKAEEGQVRLP